MFCSLNEIEAALVKAARGAGYDPSLAVAVAQGGTWLVANGQSGVESVVATLDSGDPTQEFVRSPDEGAGATVTVNRCVVGRSAPPAIDLLLAGVVDTVEIVGPDVPLLLIGLLSRTSFNHRVGFEVAIDQESMMPIADMAAGLLTGASHVFIKLAEAPPAQPEYSGRDQVSPSSSGYEVDDELWTRVNSLAAKTYVPATEASRVSGAGAGLTDND